VGSPVVSINVQDLSSTSRGNVPVTFGQVFAPGHVPNGVYLQARTAGAGSVGVPIQVDRKATHADGSLRHAVITMRVPTLASGATEEIELVSTTTAPSSGPVSVDDLLNTTAFDAVVNLDEGGVGYQASARQLLQADSSRTWLSGPLMTEWTVTGPFRRTSDNAAHSRLTARFAIRAYAGLDSVRVDVTVENTKALSSNPRNHTYNVTVTVDGKGTVLAQNSVTHTRQARWRRAFWWGADPQIHVMHDYDYMWLTGAVPKYDPAISIPNSDLNAMASEWSGAITNLLREGLIYTNMPQGGQRRDIAPLPRWAVRTLLTQDIRAKTSMLGTVEQAGSFHIHYRDENTDLPVSLDDYPNASISTGWFPSCSNNCSLAYTPDTNHQPSFGYLSYLVTGDEFYQEELQFWANWNMMFPAALTPASATPPSRETKYRSTR